MNLITCEPYGCHITRHACALRYVSAQDKRRPLTYSACRSCEDGLIRATELNPKTRTDPRKRFNPQWRKEEGPR